MRFFTMLCLFCSVLATPLLAQERGQRREGPPRAELRERLREAAERMPRLRERLEERREELRQRLQDLRERGRRAERPEGRGQQRPRGERREGGMRGEGPQRRPHLPPHVRERLRERLQHGEMPRQREGRPGQGAGERMRQRHRATDV